jgi:phosphoribosyl 1,2-cyclic phosphodiesterase
MLRRGPYPPHLKRRILSAEGHLSNATSADFLASVLRRESRRRTIWLAHLSSTNNRPALAQQVVRRALAEAGQTHVVESLPRHGLGPLWRPGEPPRAPLQMALPFE